MGAPSSSRRYLRCNLRIRRFDGVYRGSDTRVPLRDPAGRILNGSARDTTSKIRFPRGPSSKCSSSACSARPHDHAIGTHHRSAQGVAVRLSSSRTISASTLLHDTYRANLEVLPSRRRNRSAAVAREIGIVEQAPIEIDPDSLARCVHASCLRPTSRFALAGAEARAGGLKSFVAAPLMIENEVFGVLVVAKRAAESFSSDDCEFLRQLSSHVALAAHGARLYGALQDAYQDLRQTQQTVMQQERLRALGQIASGIAHDINNALSPAALYTQSMLTHATKLPTAREQLAPSAAIEMSLVRATRCGLPTCRAGSSSLWRGQCNSTC